MIDILPKITVKRKICPVCNRTLSIDEFNESRSPFFLDGHLTICKECLSKEAEQDTPGVWDFVNAVCRWADIEFNPARWTTTFTINPKGALGRYLDLYRLKSYETSNWSAAEARWKEIMAKDVADNALHPQFADDYKKELEKKWGNYDDDELERLERLYKGFETSFGLSHEHDKDNALKLCRISIEIDRAIAAGENFDKMVTSYNNLQKIAGFTNDKAHDLNNFESVGELVKYIAKLGWEEKYHNDEDKDIVDATMTGLQAYNRRLFRNETSMVEQIQEKIDARHRIEEMEASIDYMDNSELERWDDTAYQKVEDDDLIEDFEV